MAIRPQLLAGIGLLALLPVVAYLLFRGDVITATWLTVVNVLLIVGSIYYMFSPIENGHESDHGTA